MILLLLNRLRDRKHTNVDVIAVDCCIGSASATSAFLTSISQRSVALGLVVKQETMVAFARIKAVVLCFFRCTRTFPAGWNEVATINAVYPLQRRHLGGKVKMLIRTLCIIARAICVVEFACGSVAAVITHPVAAPMGHASGSAKRSNAHCLSLGLLAVATVKPTRLGEARCVANTVPFPPVLATSRAENWRWGYLTTWIASTPLATGVVMVAITIGRGGAPRNGIVVAVEVSIVGGATFVSDPTVGEGKDARDADAVSNWVIGG